MISTALLSLLSQVIELKDMIQMKQSAQNQMGINAMRF